MGKGRQRQANFELLRIAAMLMIISLHYLVKGGLVLPAPFGASSNPAGVLAWLIEAFCIVAVNCYVLISGYFLVESVWRPKRAISLLLQVLFYSLLIPVVFLLAGVSSAADMGLYDWINCALPIGTEHYWFATAYLVLYLFAPLLAAGIRQMEKRQLQMAIAFLLCFFSLEKTVFPVSLVTDRKGYDFGWFLCLFVIAGYIRKYGIPWLEKQSHAAVSYVLSCLAVWGLALFSNSLGGRIDAFAYYADMPYTYNHVLCLAGSVSLFYLFKNMRLREGRFAESVRRIAPFTFGVYLLHEHNLVRWEWMRWLGVEKAAGSFFFVPHMIMCVLLVYAVGTVVDAVRTWVFGRAAALLQKGKRWSE